MLTLATRAETAQRRAPAGEQSHQRQVNMNADRIVDGADSSKTSDVAVSMNSRPEVTRLASLQRAANTSPGATHVAQMKAIMQSGSHAAAQQKNGLPEDLQSGLESMSGLNLDDVSVHYNSPEPAKVAAHAVTQGKNIHLAPGQQRHLNHEAWHVVQQLQDRVKPTTQISGVQINDDPGLEREADHMGARAEQAGAPTHAPVAQARATGSLQAGTVSQRQPWGKFLGSMFGAWVGSNAYKQYDINKNPEKYIEGENEEQGRLRAVYETSKGKEGQASYAMRPPVSLAHLIFGNIGSAKIGGHYAYDIPHLLQGPDSDKNLENIGKTETDDYWAKQTGVSGWMGRGLSAKNRSDALKSSRDFRKKWKV